MAKAKGKALGRGLGALIDDTVSVVAPESNEIDISLIDLCTTQPRKFFDEEKLEELAESIKTYGIIQPLVLRKSGERYMIIAGERRFRAARKAGLKKVPATIKDVDEQQLLELSIIENIQREDLNPVEEALAMEMLMKEYALTQEELSGRLGKSRSSIANTVRLLALPEKTRDKLASGAISSGHAKALLGIKQAELIDAVAEDVVKKQLSVRETEAYVKKINDPPKPTEKIEVAPDILAAQYTLGERLATKVKIVGNEKKGKISIEYYSKEQLDALYEFLKNANL